MASYTQLLDRSARAQGSILCFGLDPVLEKIPTSVEGTPAERIVKFYSDIIDAAGPGKRGLGALKPNYAYFAQYGFDGLHALKELMDRYRGRYPLIFDGKRGDIGPSSAAYAREAYEFWGADALTVSPLMGADSVTPFLERSAQGKGTYLLCRTSNPGASDFLTQELELVQKPLYIAIARKAMTWHQDGLGFVVGATGTDELERLMWELERSHKPVPLLIPGVGAQGGSAAEVGRTLRTVDSARVALHRINASSSIAYAYQKAKTEDYVGAAMAEVEALNRAIGF